MNEGTLHVLTVLTERVERIPVVVRVAGALAYVALVAAVDVWTGPGVAERWTRDLSQG